MFINQTNEVDCKIKLVYLMLIADKQRHKEQQKQVSTRQSRSDLAINKMQQQQSPTAAEFSTSGEFAY